MKNIQTENYELKMKAKDKDSEIKKLQKLTDDQRTQMADVESKFRKYQQKHPKNAPRTNKDVYSI
jgi:hypothetical protein